MNKQNQWYELHSKLLNHISDASIGQLIIPSRPPKRTRRWIKLFTSSLLTLAFTFGFLISNAQIISEDFEGVTPPAIPVFWSTTGNSGSDLFKTGDSTAADADGFFPVPEHGIFAWSNDAVCNCDKADDILELPTIDLTGLVGYELNFESYHDGVYGGTFEVEVSVDNGVFWAPIHTIDTNVSTWLSNTVDLSTFNNVSSVRIRFHYDDVGTWVSGVAVDDVVVQESPPEVGVVSASAPSTVCGLSAFEQVTIMVMNFGTSQQTNIPVSYTLNGGAPVLDTVTSTINPGDSMAFTFATLADLSGAGTYNFEFWTGFGTDTDMSNDTLTGYTVFTNLLVDDLCVFDTDSNSGTDTTCGSFSSDLCADGYVTADNAIKSSDSVDINSTMLHAAEFSLYTMDCTAGDTINYTFYLNGVQVGAYMDITDECGCTPGVYPKKVMINDTTALNAPYTQGMNTWAVQNDGGANHYVAGYTVKVFGVCPIPDSVTVNTSISSAIACNGDSTAVATASTVSGTPPFTFLWDDPSAQTDSMATGLPAGTYTVMVIDSNGMTDSAMVVISEPTAVAVSTSSTKATCGNANGTAIANASGGTGAFTYLWSDPSTQTTMIAAGLFAGNFTVVVTDNNSCSNSAAVTVADNGVPNITLSKTDVSCNGGGDGTATANVAGGTAPFTYSWNDPGNQTTGTASNLLSKMYTVTVTDSNGCSVMDSIMVNEPAAALVASSTSNNPSCNGVCDGSATLTAGGGTNPYMYNWNTTPTQTNAMATALCGGNSYIGTVTDAKGCSDSSTVSITEPSALTLTTTSTPSSNNNGTATVSSVTNGVSPYTYSWNTSPVQNTATATGLDSGTYMVTVTDSTSCTASATVIVGFTIGIANIETVAAFNIAPNPFSGNTHITYKLHEKAHIELVVYNVLGELVLKLVSEQQEPGNYDYNFEGNGDNISGFYTVVLSINGRKIVKRIVELK